MRHRNIHHGPDQEHGSRCRRAVRTARCDHEIGFGPEIQRSGEVRDPPECPTGLHLCGRLHQFQPRRPGFGAARIRALRRRGRLVPGPAAETYEGAGGHHAAHHPGVAAAGLPPIHAGVVRLFRRRGHHERTRRRHAHRHLRRRTRQDPTDRPRDPRPAVRRQQLLQAQVRPGGSPNHPDLRPDEPEQGHRSHAPRDAAHRRGAPRRHVHHPGHDPPSGPGIRRRIISIQPPADRQRPASARPRDLS